MNGKNMIGQVVSIENSLEEDFVGLDNGSSYEAKCWAEKNGAKLVDWSDVDDTAKVEILIKNTTPKIYTVYKAAINEGELVAGIQFCESILIPEFRTSKAIKNYVIEKMKVVRNQDRISGIVENILLYDEDFKNFCHPKRY